MTWHSPEGDLVLAGDEREVFNVAFEELSHEIATFKDADDFRGVPLFDNMTWTQKLAALEIVAEYLFTQTAEPLELTAWSEATLATVLIKIRESLSVEIDEKEINYGVRSMLSKMPDFEEDISPESWNNHDSWDREFDAYEMRFLWDDDFRDVEFADLHPNDADALGAMMRIPQDYYANAAPDLKNDDDVPQILLRIKKLGHCRRAATDHE